jgi:predicted nucleotidyltransferase
MKNPDFNKLKTYFNSRGDAVAAYIFGSYASMKTVAESDIDIAVLLDREINTEKSGFIKQEITKDIMELISFDKVDVVILNLAPPLLCHEVIKKGELIYSGDEKKRIEFTANASTRYLDTVYLRRVQDHILHKKIRSGDFGYFKGCNKYSINKIRQSSTDSSAVK